LLYQVLSSSEVINRKTNEYKTLQKLLKIAEKEKKVLQTNIQTQNNNIEKPKLR
jgi:hypothetical protein